MFLEHVRLSPCASLNKSGCIKGSGRSKIDILHLPTKMLAQGATINRWALQYSILFKYQSRQCEPNTDEEYLLVLVTWVLVETYSEEWRKIELAWMFPTSVSPLWPFATPFHSKRGAAELFLRRALRRAPWARNVSSCALWAPVGGKYPSRTDFEYHM